MQTALSSFVCLVSMKLEEFGSSSIYAYMLHVFSHTSDLSILFSNVLAGIKLSNNPWDLSVVVAAPNYTQA